MKKSRLGPPPSALDVPENIVKPATPDQSKDGDLKFVNFRVSREIAKEIRVAATLRDMSLAEYMTLAHRTLSSRG